MIINAEGIVLRQRKIANNRRMIVLFTKQYGKLSAGTSVNEKSRSKAALALRPFTYAEYDIFKGREAYSINSAQVSKSFYSIGEDIDRFINASAFIEYLDGVLEEGTPAEDEQRITDGLPEIRKGSRGHEVRAMQALLNYRGVPVEADGDFGAETDAAVRIFQKGA